MTLLKHPCYEKFLGFYELVRSLRNLVWLAVACLFIIIVQSPVAGALNSDQFNVYNNGVYFYDTSPGQGGSSCSATGAGGGSLDKFLKTIAHQESGGDPTAHTPGNSAYGKYQYFDSTWQDQVQAYYPPASLQYQHASDAPEAVQDAVAYLEFTVQSIHENGSILRMAIEHYEPAALTDLSQLNTVPPGNRLTPREYGNLTVNDFNNNVGSTIPLYYSVAPDFATYAAKAGNPASLWAATLNSTNQLPPTNPPAGVTPSPGSTSSCGTPAGNFVFYNQNDPNWANNKYGDSTIAYVGCGPTSVAMIVATLADNSVTPAQTADWGNNNDGYTSGVGSNSNMLVGGPEHWGLKVTSIGTDFSSAITTLKSGGLIIAGGTSPGGVNVPPFSSAGHVIVIRGIDNSGNFLIGNPAPGLQSSQDEGFSANDLLSAGLKYLYEVTK